MTTDVKTASPVFALSQLTQGVPTQLPTVMPPKGSTARDFAVVQDVVRDGDALLRTVRPSSTSALQRSADWFARHHMQTFTGSLWAFGPGAVAALLGGAISMMIDPSGHTALVTAPSILGVAAAFVPASQVVRKLAEAQRRDAPQVSAEALQPAVKKFDTATGVEKAARGKVLSNLLARLDGEGGLQTTALENLRDVRNATLGLPAADLERSAKLMPLAARLQGLKTVRRDDYYAVREVTDALPSREAAEVTAEIVDYLRARQAVDNEWFPGLESVHEQYMKNAAIVEARKRTASEKTPGESAEG